MRTGVEISAKSGSGVKRISDSEGIVIKDGKDEIIMLDEAKNGKMKKDIVKTRPCKVERINEDTFKIILTQGLNRQIRKMSSVLGYKVISLKRIRIMNIHLDYLECGEYRLIPKEHIDELMKTNYKKYLKIFYLKFRRKMTLMKELHKIIEYKFIDKESKLYDSAIDLRYREFYETSNRAKEAIFDEFEDKSMRIVAYIEEKVIGHARLFVHDSIGEITQVVVDHEYRGMKIGVGIMNKLIEKAKEIKVQHITLDARVYAVEFYKRFGFETKGQEYTSLKTGMPIIKNGSKFYIMKIKRSVKLYAYASFFIQPMFFKIINRI